MPWNEPLSACGLVHVIDLVDGHELVADGPDIAFDHDADHRPALKSHDHRIGDADNLHDPVIKQALHSLTDRGLAEADHLGQCGIGLAAIALQRRDQRFVDRIRASRSDAAGHGDLRWDVFLLRRS